MTSPALGGEAIRIADLYTAFGSQKVLDGVNLSVAKGETLVVLGRSGTGKSVLLRHLIGLQLPDSGSIQVLGEEITSLSGQPLYDMRKKVGFVFQNAALYDSLSVVENVEFPLGHLTPMTPAQRRERAMEILAQVGMEEAASKMPADISGGMKKRVGLARALALQPEMMLYDEPTAGLDPITSGEISDLILKLQEEHSLSSIVVTHDMRSAKAISNRVAMLDDGKIVYDGSFEALQDSENPFVSLFVQKGGG